MIKILLMEINLIEKFILLAINKKNGKFIIDSLSLNYGIAGAILLEMSELNKIEIQKKRLSVVDIKLTGYKVVDDCIKLINNSKKPRRTRYWINKLGNRASGFKKVIINDLYNKKIIKINKSTYVWGLFTFYKYPLINTRIVDEIKMKLKRIVLESKKTDLEYLLLLSLMNSCKLTRILFPNRKEHRAANKKIKELTKSIEISEAVSQTLKEIQIAVVAATTSTYIGVP